MGCSSCGKKSTSGGAKKSAPKTKLVQKTYVQNGKKIKVLVSR